MTKTTLHILIKPSPLHEAPVRTSAVQFSHFGHPLCGDQRYFKQDKTPIALYAYKLSFIHPVRKEKMCFTLFPKEKKYWTDFTMSNGVKPK